MVCGNRGKQPLCVISAPRNSAILKARKRVRPALPSEFTPAERETHERMTREHGLPPVRTSGSHEREEHSALRNYVRDLVLGLNDGVVSVFAIVAGLAGAGQASPTIALAGIAALVAGALSMGIGEYVSTKSQAEFYDSERRREREHIARYPEIEAKELREYMERRGFTGDLLERVMQTITADKERFLDTMMREEFGMGTEIDRSPLVSMALIMLAFVAGAIPALVPFLFLAATPALYVSIVLAMGTLFVAGATRGIVSNLPLWKGGLEMTVLGAAAALITYGFGSIVGVGIAG
jgi:vacuolar iron transporter family protein